MYYKLVSRDNIESNILESWPPVCDANFTLFNNKINDITFPTEIQIFNWLDSRSRTKHAKKMTNNQNTRNGDPNKIYAVYCCDSDINILPNTYLYSIKMIKSGEPQSVIMTDDNKRIKTSFKKCNIQKHDLLERLDLSENSDKSENTLDGYVTHSSDLRQIHYKYFEGIYPISQELGVDLKQTDEDSDDLPEENKNNITTLDKPFIRTIVRVQQPKPKQLKIVQKTNQELLYEDYMQYVSAIHNLDVNTQRDVSDNRKEYDVIFSDPSDKWLDYFIEKLEKLEMYLQFLSKGGRGQFNLRYNGNGRAGGQHEIRRQNLINDIHHILKSNTDMSGENSEDFRKISNLASDPLLFDGSVYQIRYNQTLLTWHAGYSQIIKDLRIIPSKKFCINVILFNFSDFFKQYQSVDSLNDLYQNLASVYQINTNQNTSRIDHRRVRYIKKNPTIRKVTRSF
jgi:hypothetical protein